MPVLGKLPEQLEKMVVIKMGVDDYVSKEEYLEFVGRVYDLLEDIRKNLDSHAVVLFDYYMDLDNKEGRRCKTYPLADIYFEWGSFQIPADYDDLRKFVERHGLRIWDIEIHGTSDDDVAVHLHVIPTDAKPFAVVYVY